MTELSKWCLYVSLLVTSCNGLLVKSCNGCDKFILKSKRKKIKALYVTDLCKVGSS